MRISIAQLNYHIGNFEKNKKLIIDSINKAKYEKADLIVFSELSVTGYPPLDLLDHYDFIQKCASIVHEIAKECTDIAAIVGAPTINLKPEGKKLYNSALFLYNGKVLHQVNKALLPTYDIFDEYRYFEPEKQFKVINFKDKRIALTICEDLWDEQSFDNEFEKSRLYTISPMEQLAVQSPDMIINISASPFSYSRIEGRINIFKAKASKYNMPVFSVNQIGSNTELIFDGASMVINSKGEIFDRLPFFREEIRTYNFSEVLTDKPVLKDSSYNTIELIYKALITGIGDYFLKMGFKKAIIGLSGGIDSAVCLCLATNALGKENVRALLLPSRYSSDHSVKDAVDLAKTLGIDYSIINIEKPVNAFESILTPVFSDVKPDVTEENIQARIRAIILMAVSNKFGNILLNTSNKSEAAVGYGTLYGDMAGGLSVIGDVYKTDVYKLAHYINREKVIIPLNTIIKPPSAELRPGQLDTDSIPDYDILDHILYQYIELKKSAKKIIEAGFDEKTVLKVINLINNNEYKRYQAPPVLRISSKAFGSGRRMPLVAFYS
jgi:NAD+ synthase (glutamine-hydrolysing)